MVGASTMDIGRVLQQSICHDLKRKWSVSVSWGYTAQIYPWLVADNVLGMALQTFRTWKSWGNEPFTFNTRPISPEPCDQPLVYFLDNVDGVGENNVTLTSYKRLVPAPGSNDCNRDEFRSAFAVHSVNITSPTMDPVEWSKTMLQTTSPMDGVDNSVIQIRIKRCDFEHPVPLQR
ncbi:hypothetical protein MKW94_015867 [Papaver nudicaule]|uniref:Uncharacterized protein n=1 Tax=Papaver nudicaule TaxID=74823 RepID=A0AA41S5P8_PAPNU|nr:hypothetical protein [Papaver nudicaule]